ncbi:MAG: polysaccharide biosynthesis protein, partial [Pseudomonadota bacterium]
LENAHGGEIFVPKIPSYRITDVAQAIAPECEIKIVGIRPGEKIHEEMITSSDSLNTIDLGPYYAILPSTSEHLAAGYLEKRGGIRVEPGFAYDSGSNPDFLSVEELRALVRQHVDPTHTV